MRLKKILLRAISYSTRLVWRLAVLLIVMIAALVSAGREMAPLVREHKAWIEANLTASVGEAVKMQGVEAYWEGLIPELIVSKLAVGDVIQIDRALLRIDLLGSAKARAMVFDVLDINQATIRIPVGKAPDTALNFRAYREFLFGSADIRIRDLDVILTPDTGDSLPLHIDNLMVQNHDGTHLFSATISVPGKQGDEKRTPIQLSMAFDGDADNIFSGSGKAYIELGDKQNFPVLQQFAMQFLHSATVLEAKGTESLTGQIWARWQNQRIEWVANSDIKGMALDYSAINNSSASAHVAVPTHYRVDFSGKLAGHVLTNNMQPTEYWLHTLPDQDVVINGRHYLLPVLGLQYPRQQVSIEDALFTAAEAPQQLLVYVPGLNLATMSQYMELLPTRDLRKILEKLNPRGDLQNLQIAIPVISEKTNNVVQQQEVLIQARLQQVSVAAWEGVPALASVDGYLEATSHSGFVDIDSQHGFSMHYPELFRQAMNYQSAQGRVSWTIDSARHIYVGSRDVHFHGDEGDLRGSFWLDLPPHDSGKFADLYINAGLVNSNIRYRNKYLPYSLDAAMKKWLDSSIQEGNLYENGFIYRGSVAKNAGLDKTLLLYNKVKNGRLQFDENWPVLDAIDAYTLVNNEEVHAQIHSAKYFDFRMSNAVADLHESRNRLGHFLTISADAAGPAADTLNVLRETPLQKIFGDVLIGWQLNGDTRGHFDLGVKIGAAEEADFQEINLEFPGNDLFIGSIDLPLQQLKGAVHYSSTAGVTATQMSAQLWGQNQMINISPLVDNDGLPDIELTMSGNADPQALASWSHLPFVHFFQGITPAEGKLTVALDAASSVEQPFGVLTVHSDMQGLALNLPAPFTKSADEKKSSTIKVELWKNRQHYQVNYGELMTASIDQVNGVAPKGNIFISQAADIKSDAASDKLRIHATLDHALLADWLPVMDKNTAFIKADNQLETRKDSTVATDKKPIPANYPEFDVLIKKLSIGSLKLDDMKLGVTYQQVNNSENYWNVAFQNSVMNGNYRYFDNVDEQKTPRLPEVDFENVSLDNPDDSEPKPQDEAPEDDSKRVDPLADVVPQDLPAMRVHARHVIYQKRDIGDWRYVLKPNKHGVTLDELFVAMPGMVISGMEKDKGATVRWLREGDTMSTQVDSRMSLSNEDGAKNLFGMEKIIESEKTEITGSVSWKGSPAMMSFRRLQGELTIASEKGRFLNSTSSTDLMRVINVFNFSTWMRRLKLDFTDLYKKGISYDSVDGHVKLDQGKMIFDKPLIMDSPSSRFELLGTLDSVENSIDASLLVTLPVKQNATWIAALAAGLPVAVGVYVASKIFKEEIDNMSSVRYIVSGKLDDPQVKFERMLPKRTKVD